MAIIGIDPGRTTGMAYVYCGQVIHMCLATVNTLNDIPSAVHMLDDLIRNLSPTTDTPNVFIERACVRGSASLTARSALAVAEMGACFLGVYLGRYGGYADRTKELVPVMKWKGNTPKIVIHKRLLKRQDVIDNIPEKEVSKILTGKPSKWENALDACGLALWGHNKLTEEKGVSRG